MVLLPELPFVGMVVACIIIFHGAIVVDIVVRIVGLTTFGMSLLLSLRCSIRSQQRLLQAGCKQGFRFKFAV